MLHGIHWLLATHLAAHNFDGAIRNHLVDIHVGGCARARLPNDQREMVLIVELAGDDIVGSPQNGIADEWLQSALPVRLGGGLLNDAQGYDDGALQGTAGSGLHRMLQSGAPTYRHALLHATYRKIYYRTHCLRPVHAIQRHAY